MKAQELSRKYAAAIFSLALEKWLATLRQVQAELAKDPARLARLEESSRSFSAKQQELDALIPPATDQPVRNFLYTMLRDDDISLLADVLDQLERMTRGGPQVQVARVTTAIELPNDEREQFQQKLRAQYGVDLELVFEVDPAIIGGAVVQIGDKVIDGSIAARLEAMSNMLGVKR